MELTPHQKILLMLFRAIEMERQEQAALLLILKEEAQILLVEWAIDLFAELERLPTEQEIMHKVSVLLSR